MSALLNQSDSMTIAQRFKSLSKKVVKDQSLNENLNGLTIGTWQNDGQICLSCKLRDGGKLQYIMT